MNILATLTTEFSLAPWQVENTVKLIDDDNTIPFIARYRKEMTGSMDDQQLRELYDRLNYLRNLTERKEQVMGSLEEQGNLTPELTAQLAAAKTLTEVEDIYRPFRPKRRTRATVAEERGLGPLADIILAQDLTTDIETAAAPFVDESKEVPDIAAALAGASDIIAERISDDPTCRVTVRSLTQAEGFITTAKSKKAPKETDKQDKKAGVYEMYYEFSEPIKKMAGHRVLAINRGENEEMLKLTVEAPTEKILASLKRQFVKNNPYTLPLMEAALADSYKRLTAPAIEREIRSALTEAAEEGAIKVFGENLRQLLMQPPVKDKVVLAIDPGYRTGCKLAVVDETGKVLDTGIVYCTIGNETSAAKRTMTQMLNRHNANLIAIGNGTASRETEQVVAEMLKETGSKAQYTIVNEAGASVYSASKLAAEEFPEYDVSLRSAASIGRRLQDPLAELVKIDPKSMGVGQYQHDMNQKRLSETLAGVVEDCVNTVGVDLNTASPSLLSYVAGVSGRLAKNILAYREEKGKFTSRKELLKVKSLGPKAFEQCAGFLRIPGAENPLDNTGVHPESYIVANEYLSHVSGADTGSPSKINSTSSQPKKQGLASLTQAAEPPGVKNAKPDKHIQEIEEIAKKLSVGVPTLQDIIKELEKPGRDPREDLPPTLLRSDVLDMKDLKEGMILQGTVRNVIDFGAFVDIGVHQDGLVHISQICDRFIKHPLEAVQVGEVVAVKVLSVDMHKKRIALSIREANAK
ncbi:MAG: RNA-binding transcriptional accessory protein [Defluviitaleaceae bacterium]|nr:RNA-binding transcriptional accessory protein [Defluviitaleaceae bacterium]